MTGTNDKPPSQAARVEQALREGRVDTMSVGLKAVSVNTSDGDCIVVRMSAARTAMLMDNALTAMRREEADRCVRR